MCQERISSLRKCRKDQSCDEINLYVGDKTYKLASFTSENLVCTVSTNSDKNSITGDDNTN